jgi:hypothetical protein
VRQAGIKVFIDTRFGKVWFMVYRQTFIIKDIGSIGKRFIGRVGVPGENKMGSFAEWMKVLLLRGGGLIRRSRRGHG